MILDDILPNFLKYLSILKHQKCCKNDIVFCLVKILFFTKMLDYFGPELHLSRNIGKSGIKQQR